MTINVRLVQVGDFEIIQSLLHQEMIHYKNFFEDDSPFHPYNTAELIIASTLEPNNNNRGWLAFSDGKAAGIITTPQGLPGGIFVSEEFEGQGIGKALVKTRETYLKDFLGLTEVERPVYANNEKSIGLHLSLGYQFTAASSELLRQDPPIPGNTVLHMTRALG